MGAFLLVHGDREYVRRPGEELQTDLGVLDVPEDVEHGDELETHLGEPFSVRELRGPDLFEHFERTGAPMMPRDAGLVMGHTGAGGGDRVLDAGTGTGVLAAYLARAGAEVTTYETDAEFAEAAAEVVAAGHDSVEFLIAGETDLDEAYLDRVRTIIEDAGIEANVTFTGYLNDTDLLPLYQTASVFVLPSFEEGFGMVVSEAMAAGTPPVASRISGVKQQINDEQTGILVEPGNSGALAEALLDLLAHPEKRRTMGERSQERAEQFSWERITDQYIDLYERVR